MKLNSRGHQKYTLLLLVLCVVLALFALKDSWLFAEETIPQQNKAVFETSKTEGFKLTKKAIQTIGVAIKPIVINSEITLPKDALVHSLDQIAVYRLRNSWFKLVTIEVIRESGSQVIVRSLELKSGDQVVIQGAALLRVSEMDAFGGGE
ncbi:MAG: hypothetical protein AABZ55_02355 [Bdellovibrionota bacterium]